MKKRWGRAILFGMIFLLFFFLSGEAGNITADPAAGTEVNAGQSSENTVLVGGMPIGIYMETDGILVLDTQSIEGKDGQDYEPALNLVQAGDYIVGINGEKVTDKSELMQILSEIDDPEVALTIRRETEDITVKMEAVDCGAGDYKLGIWIRDNVQGLGTITFLTKSGRFGALGHGIHDTDTSVLMSITGGSLYKTSISTIIKGKDGTPGSMEGMIIYNNYNRLGDVDKNTETGIYGTVDEADTLFADTVSAVVAEREEIKTGAATIRCYIDGKVGEYDVEITEVDMDPDKINKGLVLKVTDKELLEKTGGIIQGMSGSPILQDGKLIGAVTHVFVDDPTQGYGIFAETMLEEAEKQE